MGYKKYRGRRNTTKHKLLVALLVLIILALICTIAFFLLQDKVIFTADGLRFSFSETKPDKTPPPVDTEPDIVLDDPVEPDNPLPPPPEPVEKPPAEVPLSKSVVVTAEQLIEPGYLNTLSSLANTGSLNSVSVIVKDSSGMVYIPASSRFVAGENVYPKATEVAAALRSLNDQGLKTNAVVSVCRDNLAVRAFRSGAAITGKSLWLDREYIAWFDPYKPEITEYMSGIANACVELGFSEIILENLSFANVGKTGMIDYGTQTANRFDTINALAASISDVCADKLTVSAILSPATAAELKNELSGQDVALLSKTLKRLYVPVTDFGADLSSVRNAADLECDIAPLITSDSVLGGIALEGSFAVTNKTHKYR